MKTKILSGIPVRENIVGDLFRRAFDFKNKAKRKPCLVIIQVGQKEESNRYINQKKIFGDRVGVDVKCIIFSDKISEKELSEKLSGEILKLNKNKKVDGIIVQLPLPIGVDSYGLVEKISSRKDVDGLGLASLHVPATARGVMLMLDFYKVKLDGKKVTVVGRSRLVGLPIALQCLARNATVTICHSRTRNLKEETCRADVVIAACGRPAFLGAAHFSPHQTIIDVGITVIPRRDISKGTMLVGDVNRKKVEGKVRALSPVPGGVGPLTVASLFLNLLDACEKLYF